MRLIVSLLILFAALSASADGFLLSTNAIAPERRAALEALCGRLEARGLARVPAGAKWCDMLVSYHRPFRVEQFDDTFFEDWQAYKHAWPLQEGTDGTNVFMTVDGYCFQNSAAFSCPARLLRDVALLIAHLERMTEQAGDSGRYKEDAIAFRSRFGTRENEKGKPPCMALLFAAELFRAGHEDEAGALFRAIESFGDLDGIELAAMDILAESDAFVACAILAKTDDLIATATFLEKSLARNPAKPEPPGVMNVFTSPQIMGQRTPVPRGDFRKAFLDAIRRRLDDRPKVPVFNEEEQKLAADLAEWNGWQMRDGRENRLKMSIPWLIPAAWMNDTTIPDNAATRIARLGPRALLLLLALQDDKTPVRRPQNRTTDSNLVATKGRIAMDLRNFLLPFDMHICFTYMRDEVEQTIRRQFQDIGQDDLTIVYLRGNSGKYVDMPLLWAYLARRLESEFPILETEILTAVTNCPVGGPECQTSLALTGDAALRIADLYLAVRGEAAASFRERLCEALHRQSTSFEFPNPQVWSWPGGGQECVVYFSRDKTGFVSAFRKWASKTEETFAGLRLQDGSPAAVHARAEAAAAWFRKVGWKMSLSSGEWICPSLSSFPPPLPFVSIGAINSDPIKLRPKNLRTSSLRSRGKVSAEEIEKRMKNFEKEAAELERLQQQANED